MFNMKRFLIATLFGLIFGFVCWGLSSSGGPTPWYLAVSIILSRMLIGFVIGVSVLKLGWWLHGIFMGLIFSLPMAFYGFYVPGREWFVFSWSIIMGVVYGFLIELFTTVVFKAKAQ